jgi:hypothetical protein
VFKPCCRTHASLTFSFIIVYVFMYRYVYMYVCIAIQPPVNMRPHARHAAQHVAHDGLHTLQPRGAYDSPSHEFKVALSRSYTAMVMALPGASHMTRAPSPFVKARWPSSDNVLFSASSVPP